MLLLASRRNTGRSSGKIKITFWMALKLIVIVMKKRAPFLFWTPARSYPTFMNRTTQKSAVKMVTTSLT